MNTTTTAKKFTLAVRNIEQQALWLELDGQISDGFWENARPYDHWKKWCDAEVIVDPLNLGRDFHAMRDNYNFTAKELLDVVQLRMLGTVRIARRFGIEVASMLEFVTDCDGMIAEKDWNQSEFKKAARMAGLALSVFMVELKNAVADPSYTLTNMRADLNELKVIVKMRRSREV